MSERQRLDADRVRATANGRWREILPRCGVPEWALRDQHQPCPGCGGTDRYRFDDQDGAGTFICSRGGGEPAAGDGFALLQHVHGWRFPDALRAVADALGMGDGDVPEPAARPAHPEPAPKAKDKRTTLAPRERERWAKAKTITADTPAGRYLQGRGCAIPPADGDLRWHPRVKHWPSGHQGPAVVALVTTPVTVEPITLHFTWIAPDGAGKAAVDPPRLTLPGHTNEGVVRLWPDDAVTTGLLVGEGIESCLTAAHGFTPVWSTLNAGNLKKLPVLPGIEALSIAADNDGAGLKAADACARRWYDANAEVRVWTAAQPGADMNDVWRPADAA